MKRSLAAVVAVVAAVAAAPAVAVTPGKDGRIAYEAPGDASSDIWTVGADGAHTVDLTRAAGSEDTDPAWSPNARQIAFVSDRGDPDGRTSLWLMNGNGSHVRRLGAGVDRLEPAWAPDGKRIAFTQCSAGCAERRIGLIGANGKGSTLLAGKHDSAPAWSPNGKRLVFERVDDAGDVTVWTIGANGRGAKRILDDGSQADHHPSYSPDGRQILYVSDVEGPESIYLVDVNGSSPRRVVDEPADEAGIESPAFAPSGRRIVFMSGGDLWLVAPDGTGLVQVTVDGGDRPDWGRG